MTEIDPLELGIQMSHQVGAEEVLFSDEFNLNYFGYNGANDIVAWPPAPNRADGVSSGSAPLISVTALAGRVSSIAALEAGTPTQLLGQRSVE